CAMVGSAGRSVGAGLDALAEEFGAHLRRNVAHPLAPGAEPRSELRRVAERLGATGSVSPVDGSAGLRVVTEGARAVIRPSGTEPLLKTYVEAWTTPRPSTSDREDAGRRLTALADRVAAALTS
ncbi:phospho-sugar mutase, partial [Dietzia sp. DQ11-38-2]|nr:phospho-sugar mutase [Dietzia sp. DQ11-38-2]